MLPKPAFKIYSIRTFNAHINPDDVFSCFTAYVKHLLNINNIAYIKWTFGHLTLQKMSLKPILQH